MGPPRPATNPTKDSLDIYAGSTRGLDIVLIRIRTEKVGTDAHRYKLGHSETGMCTLCDLNTPQTIRHLFFACPTLSELRDEFWPEGMPGSKKDLYEDPEKATVSAQSMIASGALHKFRSLSWREEASLRKQNQEAILAARGGASQAGLTDTARVPALCK